VPTKKEKQPLSVTHPELAKEAVGWDPAEITGIDNSPRTTIESIATLRFIVTA
jgi:hypothetical protein